MGSLRQTTRCGKCGLRIFNLKRHQDSEYCKLLSNRRSLEAEAMRRTWLNVKPVVEAGIRAEEIVCFVHRTPYGGTRQVKGWFIPVWLQPILWDQRERYLKLVERREELVLLANDHALVEPGLVQLALGASMASGMAARILARKDEWLPYLEQHFREKG